MRHLKLFEAYFDDDDNITIEEIDIHQFLEFRRTRRSEKIIDVDLLKLREIFDVYEVWLDNQTPPFSAKFYTTGYDTTVYKFEDDWWLVASVDADKIETFYLCDSIEGLKELSS